MSLNVPPNYTCVNESLLRSRCFSVHVLVPWLPAEELNGLDVLEGKNNTEIYVNINFAQPQRSILAQLSCGIIPLNAARFIDLPAEQKKNEICVFVVKWKKKIILTFGVVYIMMKVLSILKVLNLHIITLAT